MKEAHPMIRTLLFVFLYIISGTSCEFQRDEKVSQDDYIDYPIKVLHSEQEYEEVNTPGSWRDVLERVPTTRRLGFFMTFGKRVTIRGVEFMWEPTLPRIYFISVAPTEDEDWPVHPQSHIMYILRDGSSWSSSLEGPINTLVNVTFSETVMSETLLIKMKFDIPSNDIDEKEIIFYGPGGKTVHPKSVEVRHQLIPKTVEDALLGQPPLVHLRVRLWEKTAIEYFTMTYKWNYLVPGIALISRHQFLKGTVALGAKDGRCLLVHLRFEMPQPLVIDWALQFTLVANRPVEHWRIDGMHLYGTTIPDVDTSPNTPFKYVSTTVSSGGAKKLIETDGAPSLNGRGKEIRKIQFNANDGMFAGFDISAIERFAAAIVGVTSFCISAFFSCRYYINRPTEYDPRTGQSNSMDPIQAVNTIFTPDYDNALQ